MRVALVHDWLTGMRGGEKVLDALAELFPEATLFTLLHVPGTTSHRIESLPIRTAFTQKLPGVEKHYRWYLPLFPWAIESLDMEGFDLIVSSSHCAAKGIFPPIEGLHICYCHTPMRYVWDRFVDYFGTGPAARFVYGPIARRLREWDRASSERVHHFVANSRFVAERIRRYYDRTVDAIIPPPVDTEFFVPSEGPPDCYYLVVSALVPYKRIDLALEAFRGRPESLVVVGSGPSRRRLETLAGANVSFRGWVDRDELRDLYRGCRAVILPGVEDFGIVPLEAQACGRPVVALGKGGAVETVIDGETGVLFTESTSKAVSDAIDKVSSLRLDSSVLRDWASSFSLERFKSRMKAFVQERTGALMKDTTHG
ncbi:MAG TPA: glycosyltransferase [Vicinamibacteria bacterium]|nr:glycosyltransferase [Vicinamibacteria bacterium]